MDSERLSWKGNIPIDLVEDILLRLAVKAIGRCMLTCKRWYSHVKSAQFITRHLNQSKKKDTRVLIVQEGCYSIFSESHTTLIKQESGKIPFPVMERELYIMGSCRGLVLVKLRVEHGWIVLLWNPSLEKFKVIDSIIYDEPYDKWCKFELPVFALGFHEATNDYRVLRITGITEECYPEEEVDVYSFTKDSWHRVDGFVATGGLFPTITFPKEMAKYANGAVHWLAAWDQDINDCYVVLSFDFDNEVFKVIKLPDHYGVYEEVYEGFSYGLKLQELNGKLALLGHIPDDPFESYFTWVMMDYPLVESWTHVGCLFKDKEEYDIWPLVCTKKENCIYRHILKAKRDMLGYYNGKEDKIYELEVGTPYLSPVIVDFVESLDLLDVENEALEDQITSHASLQELEQTV